MPTRGRHNAEGRGSRGRRSQPALVQLHGILILLRPSPAQPTSGRNHRREHVPKPEPWSILADVAGHLQVSEDTVLRCIAKRHLPAHRVGRNRRFKLTEADLWVRAGGSPTNDDSQAGIRPVPGQE